MGRGSEGLGVFCPLQWGFDHFANIWNWQHLSRLAATAAGTWLASQAKERNSTAAFHRRLDGKPGQMVHINLCHLMRNALLCRTAEFNLIFSSFVLVVVVVFFFPSSTHFALILFALVIFVDYSGLIWRVHRECILHRALIYKPFWVRVITSLNFKKHSFESKEILKHFQHL